MKKWSSRWMVDDILEKKKAESQGIYGLSAMWIGYDLPTGIQEELPIFPRAMEVIEPNSKRAQELAAQKAAVTNKVLENWIGQTNQQMGTQYRYKCTCPSLHCINRVEFFSYKSPSEIGWDDAPKCQECSK